MSDETMCDGNQLKQYINEDLVNSNGVNYYSIIATSNVPIGDVEKSDGLHGYFKGTIDDIDICNYALQKTV